MKWMSRPSISVVNCAPVARELLQRRQLHALRRVFDELLGWPAHRGDAAAQLSELLFWNVDVEGANLSGVFDGGHDQLLSAQ